MFDPAIIPKLREPIDEVRETCLNRFENWTLKRDVLKSVNPFQDVLLGSTHVLDTIAGTLRSKIARFFHQKLGDRTCEILEIVAGHHAWAGRHVWAWQRLKTDFPHVTSGRPVLVIQTGHFIDVIIVKSRPNTFNGPTKALALDKALEIAKAIQLTESNRIVRVAAMAPFGGASRGFTPDWDGFDWFAQGQAAFMFLTADSHYYRDFVAEIEGKFVGNRINQTVDAVLVRLVNEFINTYCDMGGQDPTPYVRSFIEHNGPIQWKIDWGRVAEDTMGNAAHAKDVSEMARLGLIPAGTKAVALPRATFDAPDSVLSMFGV